MIDAIIVDVDGTVALNNGRSPYDWSRVSEDLPNKPVIAVVEAMARTGVKVIFCSGRSEECRPDTEKWLAEHLSGIGCVGWGGLFMRKAGDYRQDFIVKAEILEREILPNYNVVVVFDDRDSVVKMWRQLGLTCLQVAPGKF